MLWHLKRCGSFALSPFRDVCLGRVEDTTLFLQSVAAAKRENAAWVRHLARVIPIENTFHFTPETLTAQLKAAMAPFIERMASGTFHVRLERRGLGGKLPSPAIEQEVAEHIFAVAEQRGLALKTSFNNPDYILCAETVGNDCGVALLSRETFESFPFTRPH